MPEMPDEKAWRTTVAAVSAVDAVVFSSLLRARAAVIGKGKG
jgi:hypothetical protein